MAEKSVTFEDLGVDSIAGKSIMRSKVPGGWLVIYNKSNIVFYADPNHEWDGSALPG